MGAVQGWVVTQLLTADEAPERPSLLEVGDFGATFCVVSSCRTWVRMRRPGRCDMRVKAHGETRRKLEHIPGRLTEEFPDEPDERVEREVEVVSGELLTRARFPDFVPLLVHRFLREHLLDRGARRRAPHITP